MTSDLGETFRLAAFRGKKAILYFFPKAGTKGRTDQATGFRDEFQRIREANGVVICG